MPHSTLLFLGGESPRIIGLSIVPDPCVDMAVLDRMKMDSLGRQILSHALSVQKHEAAETERLRMRARVGGAFHHSIPVVHSTVPFHHSIPPFHSTESRRPVVAAIPG